MTGDELWKTDGTDAGTVLVKDIAAGADDSDHPRHLTAIGSTLYFTANDGVNGEQFWKTDGTAAGTVLIKGGEAGVSGVFPYGMTAVGPTLYFTFYDAAQGFQFWTDKVFTINVTNVAEPLVVESVTMPVPGSYKAGERLAFVMNLSLPATVKGAPQLQFKVGSTMRVATYVGGSGTTRLEFRYTVRPNDYAETVSLGARFAPSFAGLGITAGTRRLAAVLPAGVAGAVATGVRIDAVPPRAVGRVTGPAAGSYEVGQALTFVVTFSEPVFVWGGEGAWITLTGITGGPMQALPRQAAYVSGSGTNQLTFRYVVQDGDTIAPGKVLTLGNRITLDAGTRIVDRDGKNDALLSISPPSLAKARLAAALPTSRKSAFAALGRSA